MMEGWPSVAETSSCRLLFPPLYPAVPPVLKASPPAPTVTSVDALGRSITPETATPDAPPPSLAPPAPPPTARAKTRAGPPVAVKLPLSVKICEAQLPQSNAEVWPARWVASETLRARARAERRLVNIRIPRSCPLENVAFQTTPAAAPASAADRESDSRLPSSIIVAGRSGRW